MTADFGNFVAKTDKKQKSKDEMNRTKIFTYFCSLSSNAWMEIVDSWNLWLSGHPESTPFPLPTNRKMRRAGVPTGVSSISNWCFARLISICRFGSLTLRGRLLKTGSSVFRRPQPVMSEAAKSKVSHFDSFAVQLGCQRSNELVVVFSRPEVVQKEKQEARAIFSRRHAGRPFLSTPTTLLSKDSFPFLLSFRFPRNFKKFAFLVSRDFSLEHRLIPPWTLFLWWNMDKSLRFIL